MNIAEYAADKASSVANKVTGAGFGVTLFGGITSEQCAMYIGLIITVLGGIWSFMAFMQKRSEHKIRMKILEAELKLVQAGKFIKKIPDEGDWHG